MLSKNIYSIFVIASIALFSGGIINLTNAQVEIPEAKIVDEDDTSEELGGNSTLLTYVDEDLGFSLTHPSSWEENPSKTNAYNLVRFDSPDGTAGVYVFLFPSKDDQSLKSFGDEFVKDDDNFKINEYYRNSTTKLADQPAIRASGTYFNTVTPYEAALGYKSTSTKTLQVYTFSEANDGFFAVILHADDSKSYDKHLPEVEQMIKSFKINSTGPIFNEEN